MGTDLKAISKILLNKDNFEIIKEKLSSTTDKSIIELLLNKTLTLSKEIANRIVISHIDDTDKEGKCIYILETNIYGITEEEEGIKVYLLEIRMFRRYIHEEFDSLVGVAGLGFNLVGGEYILDKDQVFDSIDPAF